MPKSLAAHTYCPMPNV